MPDWSTIDEATFNAVVEALLVAEFTVGGNRARAINGRGGDSGIDVGVWDESNVVRHVFQLKHYRNGWSSSERNRRMKIKDSFERAWEKHAPEGWSLVTASNPTLSELQFVKSLRGDRSVAIDVLGPAELDALLGTHRHIHDRFFTDRALELLSAVHRPEELLQRSGDLPVVLARVHERLRARSAWWGSRVTLDPDGGTTEEIVALTDDAAIQEPLAISLSAQFPPDQDDLRAEFEKGLRFGFVEPLVLPHEVITSFVKTGPDWWAGDVENVVLALHPTDHASGLPVVLTALGSRGTRLGALEGQVVRAATGSEGFQVVVDHVGGLTSVWRLPEDKDGTGEVSFSVNAGGHRVRDVRRLARFLRVMRDCSQVALRVGDASETRLNVSRSGFVHDKAFEDFLEDLIAIEDLFDVTLTMPHRELTATERVWARVLVRIGSGYAVPYPDIDGFNFTQSVESSNPAESRPGGFAAVLVQKPDFAVELLDSEVHVGHVFVYQSYGKITVGREIPGTAETVAQRDVNVRAVDDLPFLIYAPEQLKPGKGVVIRGWGIQEIPEHKRLSALRARIRKDRPVMPAETEMRTTDSLSVEVANERLSERP